VKAGQGQVYFTPHLESWRGVLRHSQREASDGSEVLRNILTAETIAASGPGGEPTIHVGQSHRQAINLVFTDEVKAGMAEQS